MTATRFINPHITWAGEVPVKFEYELVVIDTVTGEIFERTPKKFPWVVTDLELEEIGTNALVEYLATHPNSGEPDTSPPILDWPFNGPE